MKTLKNKLINTLVRIPLDGGVNPIFGLCCGILGLFQLIAALTDPDSSINIATNWSDPNVYISTTFMVIFGATCTAIYSTLFLIKLIKTEPQENITKDNSFDLFSTLLAYMRVICETIVLGPFVISCLKTFTKNPQEKGLVAIAIVGLILYFTIVYPITLYCTSDTTALTGNGDRKYSVLNAQLFINVYKLLFVINAVMSNTANLVLCPIFFVLYCTIIYFRPFYCYGDQAFKRGTLSIVAFICIARAFNALFGNTQGNALIEILGSISFAFLVEYVATVQLQSTLEEQKMSLYKAKILIFMAQNSQKYLEYLQKFLLAHHSNCYDSTCQCNTLIPSITSKNGFANEQLWFRFVSSCIESVYNLKGTDQLSRTEIQKKIQDYRFIVFDLAQIHLLKLNKKNAAFILVQYFKSHLDLQALEELWDTRRARSFYYYFNLAIQDRTKIQKSLNYSADKYMDFQFDYNKYIRNLFCSVESIASFWKQLLKNSANETLLSKSIKEFQTANREVNLNYQNLIKQYAQSRDIVDPITWDYLNLVLNMGQDQPLFLVGSSSEQIAAQKRMKSAKIEEKAKLYSFDSETPTCLISANPRSLGRIQFSNNFFDELIDKQCGHVQYIDELIIPELAPWHRQKMEEFVQKDALNHYHNNSFIVTSNLKLIYMEVMIQIIPSVKQGLRYSLFIKKYQPQRQIFISKAHQLELLYSSQSFQKVVDGKISYQSFADTFDEDKFRQIKEKKQIQLKFQEDSYMVHILSDISDKNVLLLEIKSSQEISQNSIISKSLTESRIQKDQTAEQQNSNQHKRGTSTWPQDQNSNTQQDQSSKKKSETVKNIFYSTILQKDKKQKNFITTAKKVSVISTIAIIIGLVAFIMVKKNVNVYAEIWNNNQDFYNVASLVASTTDNLEVLNIYPTVTSQTAYTALTNTPSIDAAFNQFRSFFDPVDTEKPWGTLTFAPDKTFTFGSSFSNLAVNSYLQTPLNTLSTYPKASYSFETSYQLLAAPLSQIQQDFYTFVINSLYFALPNLSALKADLFQSETIYHLEVAQFKVEIPLIAILLISIAVFVVLLCLSVKMKNARNNVYSTIDQIESGIIEDRIEKVQRFAKKYNSLITDYNKTNKKASIFQSNFAMSRNVSKVEKAQNLKNNSRVAEDTQLELNSRFKAESSPSGLNVRSYDSVRQNKNPLEGDRTADEIRQNKKGLRQQIFTPKSCCGRSIILLLALLPLALYSIICSFSQFIQRRQILNLLTTQQTINQIQLANSQLRLYLLHYGTYDPQLQNYRNIPATVSFKLQEIANKVSLIPSYQDNPSQFKFNDDICQMAQNGIYNNVNFVFANWNDSAACAAVDSGILTQGFEAALQSYLTSASNLLNNHHQPATFNSTQRQAYFNDPFFTSSPALINYLNLHLKWVNSRLQATVADKQSLYKTLWIAISGCMIGIVVVLLILAGRSYLKQQTQEIHFVQSSYLMISYRSTVKEDKFKEYFLKHQQNLKILK